jgi:hypothetical protein
MNLKETAKTAVTLVGEPLFKWHIAGNVAFFLTRGGRQLHVFVAQSPEGWLCIALESSVAGAEETIEENLEKVFDDHAHKTVGAYSTLQDGIEAGEAYGVEWLGGVPTAEKCSCEEIPSS